MFKRFLIAILIFFVAVVIAADRIGAIVGAHVLASKLQTDEHLPSKPSASIGGIPFLTQAFGGKYSDVHVTANAVPVNHVTVTTLKADLHGVHIPMSKVLNGDVSQVPVDRVDGSAFVSYSDANSYLSKHTVAGQTIQLREGSGGEANIADTVSFGGHKFLLHGLGSLSVSNNVVTVSVRSLSGAPKPVVHKVLGRLGISFPLQGLPFRMIIHSVSVTPTGIMGTASANQIVLGSPTG